MSRSKTSLGFTLTEILVVLAIIAIVAAILMPVYGASKKRARIADDLQRLHQCQLAVSLYAIDNDGGGVAGTGLPDVEDWVRGIKVSGSFYGSTFDTWSSACGQHPMSLTSHFVLFSPGDAEGLKQVMKHGEHLILIADENCNDPNVDVSADYVTKTGIGVLRDGTLVRRTHQGEVYTWAFWEETP